jgi:hypothetical protein
VVLGVGLLLGPLGAGAQFLAFAGGFGAQPGVGACSASARTRPVSAWSVQQSADIRSGSRPVARDRQIMSPLVLYPPVWPLFYRNA